MLRLNTFGSVFVARDGRALGAAGQQRRVLALLTIVAAARERGVSRDRVLSLLWSEGDPAKSRQALTQTLYHTRRALQQDDLFIASADLHLNPAAISSDIDDFESALEHAELERAATVYVGPFLDGFFVNDAPEFERWASEERARLANRCAHSLEQVAAAAESASDFRRAVEWRKRLAAMDPLNSRIALELMTAMAAAGDRAGAIRHARIHATLLQEELGSAPDAAISELAARLREESSWVPADIATIAAMQRSAPATDGAEAHTKSALPPEPPSTQASAPITVEPPRATDVAEGGRTFLQSLVHARKRLSHRLTAPILLVIAAVVLVVLLRARGDRPSVPITARDIVVVVPFRVSGADAALNYLREGMIDLLVTKLADDASVLVADPGTVMSAWRRAGLADRADARREDAVRIAQQLGGERLIFGAVVGTPQRVVLSASVLGVQRRELRAQATVEGPSDSLTVMVDRLVARLLAQEAGAGDRLASHTSTSLAALRAFLDGQAAYRRGSYRTAVEQFGRALEADPTFALAGVGLAQAADRIGVRTEFASGIRAAWEARGDLTQRDRAYLDAMAGPRYPAASPPREQLAAWERAATLARNRADVWHELGERLFYDGQQLGLKDWRERSTAAFRRAVELDSSFASPLQYLVQLAAAVRDTSELRRVATTYLRVDSTGELAAFVRWRAAVALSEAGQLQALRRRFGTMPAASLRMIALSSQYHGIEPADADRALAVLQSRTIRGADRSDVLLARHALALNRGHPDLALRLVDDIEDLYPASTQGLRLRVLDALYAGGDSGAAATSALRLTRADSVWRLRAGGGVPRGAEQRRDLCALGQWHAWNGDPGVARDAATALVATPALDAESHAACSALIEAVAAVRERRPDAMERVELVDSLHAHSPLADDLRGYLPIVRATLHETMGGARRALGAIRERPYMREWPLYLTTQMRAEGALAAATNDTLGAIRSYRHFLALWSSPEPRASPIAETARAALLRLGASPRPD